jgi:hypothetical protein
VYLSLPRARLRSFSVNELSPGRTRRPPVPEGHDQGREGGDRVLKEETRDEQRPSDLDGGAADAADLELPALPPCDRDEEHRELLEFPHPRPLGRVVAPRAGSSIPRAQVLLLGAEAEEEDHDRSVGGDPCCSVRRGPPAWALAARPRTAKPRRRRPASLVLPAAARLRDGVQTWGRPSAPPAPRLPLWVSAGRAPGAPCRPRR